MATSKSGSSRGSGGKASASASANASARRAPRDQRSAASSATADAPFVALSGSAADQAAPAAGARATERAAQATKRAAGAAANAAFDALRRAVEATPTIVLKAACIIEEEVAMGIGAVKRIEQRFLDVEALRNQSSDHVMSRFRKDAHEAIDIILDVVTAAATTVGQQAGRVVNVTASRMTQMQGAMPSSSSSTLNGATDAGATRLPTVRMPGKVAPGGSAELTMSLENESDQTTAEFTLHSSELVSASGARVSSGSVTFSPATLTVGPRATGTVTVRVSIPAGTPAGSYEGLLRATQLDGLRAMITVQVG